MTTAVYIGPNRRLRTAEADHDLDAQPARSNGGRLLLVLGLVLVVAVTAPFAAGQLFHDAPALGEARSGVAALSTSVFVAAALSYLLRWKLTGEAPVALVGVALLVYGTVLGLFVPLAPELVGEGVSAVGATTVMRTLTALVVMYLLARSLSTPIIDARLRPGRVFAVAVSALALSFALLALLGSARSTPPSWDNVASPLSAVLAAGWGAVALMFVRRAADRLQGDVLWLGLALGCLCLANLMRSLPVGQLPEGLLAATTVSALAGAVALFGGARHLTGLLGTLDSERLSLSVDLDCQGQLLLDQQERREESLHDVRSTLAAIRCAAGTLLRYDGRLASTQRASLTSAVTSELVRLGRLIDPADVPAPAPFDIRGAITGVVETERALGSEILLDLRAACAVGRPEDAAAIVQNLLVNARRYAKGSPVRIGSCRRHGQVEISVEDSGPGLTPREREEVFGRGQRGSSGQGVPGSGLGLFVSRRLATEQGGDLLVTSRRGGGARFVLRLPAAEQTGEQGSDLVDGLRVEDAQPAVG